MANRKTLWTDALIRLKKERLAVLSFWVLVAYGLAALLAQFGVIATPWDATVGERFQSPSFSSFPVWMGTDIFGRSVIYKVIHGARVAMSVGFVSCCLSIPFGVFLGATAGYFGRWYDDLVVWFYTTLSSVPDILLLLGITFVLGKGLSSIYVALSLTSWIGIARVIRGEVIKQKTQEYVLAAESLGASHFSRIFKHILPNVFHFVIVNFSILFVSAIKAEVILSFLGLGVQGQPSWGLMIDDAKMELSRGVWWQLAGATSAMFFVILALNMLGDALRDALDPKLTKL